MQLGPSLSPDGKRAVFFSERDRLSLDLFLADVKGGQVIRKLATTAASARFDSLQALRSTGTWSPEGDWFAFPAVRQGHAALMLMAMREGQESRELVFNQLGQVLSPTWSPDGKSIAFSALAGGFTDLYLFDLSTNTLRQLTDDSPADLQPAWSHDGRTIAFVTERYSSDFESLTFGRPQLALFDLATDTVRRVDVGDIRAQLSPQWSLDRRCDLFRRRRRRRRECVSCGARVGADHRACRATDQRAHRRQRRHADESRVCRSPPLRPSWRSRSTSAAGLSWWSSTWRRQRLARTPCRRRSRREADGGRRGHRAVSWIASEPISRPACPISRRSARGSTRRGCRSRPSASRI